MLRVNYRHPDGLPAHQRDFPRGDYLVQRVEGSDSTGLALMVVLYLVALLAGILLLGYVTAPTLPSAVAEVSSAKTK